jgi:hypothetical protein
MHITHDNTSDKKINVETGSENRLLTNVRILHDGMLTYTYIHLLEHQITHNTSLTESSRQYVEYVDIEHNPATNDIFVSYHTKVLKFNNTGVHDTGTDKGVIDTFGDDTYRFITNVYQDIDGHLSYTYVDVKTYSHHNTYNLGEQYATGSDPSPRYIINSIYLDDTGGLSYTYRNATIEDSDISHSADYDISNTDAYSYGMPVITGIHMTSDGQLSYAWAYICDPHDDHGTYTASSTVANKAKEDTTCDTTDGKRFVINNIYLNSDGYLSYTWRDARISDTNVTYNIAGNTDISNADKPENGIKVITGIHMTSDGQLSYTYSYVYDPHDDHITYTAYTYTTVKQSYQLVMNTYLNANGGMTYCVMDIWGAL